MIRVYKTKSCAYCRSVQQMLDKHNSEYELVELDDNPKLHQEIINKSGAMTVPIIVKNDWEDFIVGWQPAKLLKLIKE